MDPNYERNGFEVYRNLLSVHEIGELNQNLERIITKSYIHSDLGSYINYADKSNNIVNSIHRINELNDEYFVALASNSKIVNYAHGILKEEPVLFSMQAFLKPAGVGLGTPAHQDNAYWFHDGNGGITIWIALDKNGPFNGSIMFALNETDKLLTHRLSTSTPGSSKVIPDELIQDYEWYQPSLNPGDATVHHGLVVHKSEKNTSEFPRRGFLLNYRGISMKKNLIEWSVYNKTLENIYGRS